MTKAKPSTAFGGVLLFDFGNKVANFTGDPSTRGMFDRWKHNSKKEISVTVEYNEDYPDYSKSEYESWFLNDETGNCEIIMSGSYKECLEAANDFMVKY